MPAIRLAFSPDSDDIFMFFALIEKKIDTEGYTFVVDRKDTEALNEQAGREEADVIAVSMARYATVADTYWLLPHGASVGRGYGPALVAKVPRSLESLAGLRIGVPGLRTTAALVLRLLLADFVPVVIPVSPYRSPFDALSSGEVDAAVIIHEGRLTFEDEGFRLVQDLGVGWAALTGLPLPLGGNAIRRSLGPFVIADVSRLCRGSIAWALDHREEVMSALLERDRRQGLVLSRRLLDRYLGMYANQDTLDLPEDAREGVRELLRRGAAAGLLPDIEVTFAP